MKRKQPPTQPALPITENELRAILRGVDKGRRRASDIRRLVAFVRTSCTEIIRANVRADASALALKYTRAVEGSARRAAERAAEYWRRRAIHAENQVINVRLFGHLFAELQGADGVWRTYDVT